MSAARRTSAVLFDLDGTLLDTAPDMVGTLQQLQAEESHPPLPFERARPFVSNGVLGLLRAAFGDLADDERGRLQQRFINIYARRLADHTRPFPGIAGVLGSIEAARVPWGVVTNKPTMLTVPLLEQLGLRARCACVVSGDTVGRRKPEPDQLIHALALMSLPASGVVYVGDAQRDIAAGRAAGMITVAALYGYIPPGDDPQRWGADYHVHEPADLMDILKTEQRSGGTP